MCGNLEDLSVLVLDGAANMRKIIMSMLRSFGVTNIFDAETTTAALQMLSQKPIDLLITDFNVGPDRRRRDLSPGGEDQRKQRATIEPRARSRAR